MRRKHYSPFIICFQISFIRNFEFLLSILKNHFILWYIHIKLQFNTIIIYLIKSLPIIRHLLTSNQIRTHRKLCTRFTKLPIITLHIRLSHHSNRKITLLQVLTAHSESEGDMFVSVEGLCVHAFPVVIREELYHISVYFDWLFTGAESTYIEIDNIFFRF